MDYRQLTAQIGHKKSFLCLGLDTDINLIPAHLRHNDDPLFAFNKAIVDATLPYIIAVKPNIAFYESLGPAGWQSLEKIVHYIRNRYPELFLIADAKRGDIGNTSKMYAKAFLDTLGFDAVTLSPYMGSDSVIPYLAYEGKWAIILALTSNQGAADFQLLSTGSKERLYETVVKTAMRWGTHENIMFVAGATRASMLLTVRDLAPNHFLLVPGIGAQGGSLAEVAQYGFNNACGLIVNASRSILYASSGSDFAEAASQEAEKLQTMMEKLLPTIPLT